MLRRLFPHPWLTVLLALVWLMLVNGFAAGSVVFGLILGTVIPWLTAPYWPNRAGMRNPMAILGYIGIVLYDIVMANITVAKIILFKSNAQMHPAWVTIPLDLRSPEAITVLAGTITMTPGTVTAEMSADGRALLVHCLDAPDPDAIRDEIKTRYEARLKEIFE